ncbi:Lrp/AsnC family transcriptional regulator [Xanthobacter dioxanivorans]|uniref:Lrp/AsnC family transcriptional regulator n=2 Tax=Xanthobacter dioxanivorans TaxID=2528964 RepID=A0A974PPT4_9HYPH|nr:Lrp/AsnC family transcriptional regulator [Xanthobacter dioxanivorans]QRG07236.1 Lrp/AsnC family transcriptional regulator [Xanthobacter dioxanivorans]
MLFDDMDLKILEELQANGRLTNVELASRVGLSPSPCLARVRSLEEAGIIGRYVALLDAERIGPSVSVFIQITLERQSDAFLAEFETVIAGMPEVMECYLMSGDSDYLLRVLVRDTVHLRDFVRDTLTKLPGVAKIRSSFALKQVKYQTALPLGRMTDARGPRSRASHRR